MRAERRLLLALFFLILLPFLSALVGWVVGPRLARMDYAVQVAEQLYREEQQDTMERTDQSDAWRATGKPFALVYERAAQQVERFRWGTMLAGAFCGLVVALKMGGLLFHRPHHEYEALPAWCVACGRCFKRCPVHWREKGIEPPFANWNQEREDG